jgi:hypothetical protein
VSEEGGRKRLDMNLSNCMVPKGRVYKLNGLSTFSLFGKEERERMEQRDDLGI